MEVALQLLTEEENLINIEEEKEEDRFEQAW